MKRDANAPASTVTTTGLASSSSSSSSLTTSTSTSSKAPEQPGIKSDIATTDDNSTQHLLGENGAGQRKYYPPANNSENGTKISAVLSEPSPSSSSSSSSPAGNPPQKNKTLGAVPSTAGTTETEATVSDQLEDTIGHIDEPTVDNINNVTLPDEFKNIAPKTDYFQYYNSTMTVDKNKSDEYWSDNKKEYTISNILSKSHRRAIVSIFQTLHFYS